MTILVADDDPCVLRLVARVLRLAGFRVLSARSGEELLKLWQGVRGQRPVILSDIQMPGELDGIRACERIRQADPRARVFLMTGDPERSAEAQVRGLAVALRKPFSVERLREWSGRLLDAAGCRRSALPAGRYRRYDRT